MNKANIEDNKTQPRKRRFFLPTKGVSVEAADMATAVKSVKPKQKKEEAGDDKR